MPVTVVNKLTKFEVITDDGGRGVDPLGRNVELDLCEYSPQRICETSVEPDLPGLKEDRIHIPDWPIKRYDLGGPSL